MAILFIQQVLNGLLDGVYYLLIALGLSLIFSLGGIVNLAHGAFYAIVALAVIMFVQPLVHIPEVVTGLGGATLIGISLWSSIRWNRKNHESEAEA